MYDEHFEDLRHEKNTEKELDEHNHREDMRADARETEVYKCPSFYDDSNVLKDCSCGKCGDNSISMEELAQDKN